MVEETKKNQAEMRKDGPADAVLAPFFAAARATETKPSDALMERILQDATSFQGILRASSVRKPHDPSFLSAVINYLGGWRGVSALTACVTTGVIVGFAVPDSVAIWSMGLVHPEGAGDLSYFDAYGTDGYIQEHG